MTPLKPTETKKTSLNMELFKKIKKHLKARPARLRMENWVRKGEPKSKVIVGTSGYGEPSVFILPDCGTVGCIAGWAVILSDDEITKTSFFGRDGSGMGIASMAASDLGINPAHRPFELFYVDYWPHPYNERYKTAKTQKERVKIVCEVIDEFTAQHQIKEENW